MDKPNVRESTVHASLEGGWPASLPSHMSLAVMKLLACPMGKHAGIMSNVCYKNACAPDKWDGSDDPWSKTFTLPVKNESPGQEWVLMCCFA